MRRYAQSTILIALTAGFFVTFFGRMAISPVVPFIAEDFEISNAVIGLALSGMWLAYGLVQYPSGILGDRYGERRVVLLAVGGSTLGVILLALSPGFVVFVLFVIGFGAMAGLHYSPATTLLSKTQDDIGRAVGIHLLGSPLAGLIAPIIAAPIGARYGWRPAIATAVIVGIPTYALILWGVPATEPAHGEASMVDRLSEGAGLSVITRPEIAFTLVIAMIGTFVMQGLLSFIPTFLYEFRTFSPTLAGTVFAAFFIIRAVSQFALGSFSDSYGRDLAIIIAMGAGAIGLAGMVYAPAGIALALGVGLAGFGMGFFAVTDPRFIDALGEDEQGSGFGVVRTGYTVFGSAGSVGVGALADWFGWDVSFLVLAVMLGSAGVAMACNYVFDLGY